MSVFVAPSWNSVENAQIDGSDLCMADSSGAGFTEVAAQNVKETGDDDYYYPDEYYTGGGWSDRGRLLKQSNGDPYYASCKPIKVCDVEDTVKSKCEGLAGCVAFNYDGSCGVLKTNSTGIKSPSDNGTMKVWYLEG